MQKKYFIYILLYLIPLVGFSEENPDANNEQTNKEIALNDFPADSLKKDLINNTEIANDDAPQKTFPIETTVGFDFENTKGKYFLQTTGKDYLNEEKTRSIDFLIKVPYQIKADTPVSLETFNLNFIDPSLHVTLGDLEYTITPLIFNKTDARGSLIKASPNEALDFCVYYLKPKEKKDMQPSENAGSYLVIKPHPNIAFSPNVLFKKFKNKQILEIPKKNYIYSIKSAMDTEPAKINLEAAAANKFNQNHLAYFIEAKTNIKSFALTNNLIYANQNFSGNYTDEVKSENNLKYQIKKLKFDAVYNFKRNNLQNSSLIEKTTKEKAAEFRIGYPLIKNLDTLIKAEQKKSLNPFTKDGYKVEALNLNLSIPLKKYTLENSIAYGIYKSKIENYKSRKWQNAQLSLNYNSDKEIPLSVYTKLGNILYENIFTNSYVAGTSIKLNFIKNLNLEFAYEYSKNQRKCLAILDKKEKMKWNRNYFKQELTYLFPNKHKLTLSSHINQPMKIKKEKAFLLTYTVPLEVPNINRTINSIKTLF